MYVHWALYYFITVWVIQTFIMSTKLLLLVFGFLFPFVEGGKKMCGDIKLYLFILLLVHLLIKLKLPLILDGFMSTDLFL